MWSFMHWKCYLVAGVNKGDGELPVLLPITFAVYNFKEIRSKQSLDDFPVQDSLFFLNFFLIVTWNSEAVCSLYSSYSTHLFAPTSPLPRKYFHL